MKIKYLNGHRFLNSIIAGAMEVFRRKEFLDKINYFPVADNDTGTNIAITFRKIIDRISNHKTERIDKSSRLLADLALESAQGNSGVIFAQYFYGFSKEIGNEVKITTEKFGEAVRNAVNYAYKALSNPREGTILSVMREWSEYVHSQSKKIKDFSVLITNSVNIARKSLASTKEKLEVLRKRNVVDSGAMGFVCFLEGIVNFIKSGSVKEIKVVESDSIKIDKEEPEYSNQEEPQFRWCTECILKGQKLNVNNIRKTIEGFGDSVVVAGGNSKLRIHIHTDVPHIVVRLLKEYGEIVHQKADDMLMQYRIAHTSHPSVAVVVDSGCDIPGELIEKYMINTVPVKVILNETVFLDRVTITPSFLYEMLDKKIDYPTTSQPSPSDFKNLYSFLLKHYKSIISIHLPDKLSGTYQNALKAASDFPDGKIIVIDSGLASAGIGHLAITAAELAWSGKSCEEIAQTVEKMKKQTQLFVYIDTLKYLMRSGRISPIKGLLARFINVKPILKFDEEGGLEITDKAFSKERGLKKLLNCVQNFARNRKISRATVIHFASKETGERVKTSIEKSLNITNISVLLATPALGVHAGRGAVGVAITWG